MSNCRGTGMRPYEDELIQKKKERNDHLEGEHKKRVGKKK